MARFKTIEAPNGHPWFGWDEKTIKAHLIANPLNVGDPMIIYNSHANIHRYQLATVESPSLGPQKRVALSKSGQSGGVTFHRSGINTYMPKGQTRMLPPIPELMAHLEADCDVILDLPLFG